MDGLWTKLGKYKPLIILLGVVIALQVILALIVASSFSTWGDRGTFGDMFGAINTLFAGLAFAGIIFAIILQAKELELQREELGLTRNVLKEQKEQLQNQNETLQLQNFENTFFQMFRLHNEIVNGIEERHSEHGRVLNVGRGCFIKFYTIYVSMFKNGDPKDPEYPNYPPLKKIDKAYKVFLSVHQTSTGHYFRNLYNIIKFVKNSKITNKRLYTNLVRAQLSSHELVLLFYNCLSSVGNEKFKPLVEEFALLKNMSARHLIDRSHKQFYESSAYKPSAESLTAL